MGLFTISFQLISKSWYVLAPIVFLIIFKSVWFKGLPGEFIINATTRLFLNKDKYHIVENVVLYTENGPIQIDHIIVSIYGVFVVNKKNLKGWIFGNKTQKIWTQKINDHRCKFQNPLQQNYKHIEALPLLLGLDKQHIHSLVVFLGDCTFKTEMPDNVLHDEGYLRFIKSKEQPVISEPCVSEILKIIERSQVVPSFNTRSEYVKYVCQILSVKSIY